MEFEKLLKRLSPKLKAISYKLGRFFPVYLSDDLYQEALTHLWQKYQQGELNDKTDSYILQGCYFCLRNYIRTSGTRRQLVSLQALLNEEGEVALEDTRILQDRSSLFMRERLSDKLLAETIRNNGFSLREKFMLALFSQSMTTREVGREMGVSHVAVQKMMGKLRKKAEVYLDLDVK